MAKKKVKTLEENVREFVAMWDEYWNSGFGEGPSHKDFQAKLDELRKQVSG